VDPDSLPDLDNPYLDEVNPYLDEVPGGDGGGPAGAPERSGGSGEDAGDDADGVVPGPVRLLERRERLVEEYAWAVPNAAAIAAVADEGPILEVGAGGGYWAMLLRQAGVDVIATDPDPPTERWSPVAPVRAQDVVADHPDRALLLVWPSGGDRWAAEALAGYEGDTCIYVGEGPGGATADEQFHRLLREHWRRERTVDVPQYPGIRDRLEVWRADEGSPLPSLRALGRLSPGGRSL